MVYFMGNDFIFFQNGEDEVSSSADEEGSSHKGMGFNSV